MQIRNLLGSVVILIGLGIFAYQVSHCGIKLWKKVYLLHHTETINPRIVNPELDNKIVHFSVGAPRAHERYELEDDILGYSFAGQLTLREDVEYCQWNEVKSDSGEVTYKKGWFDKVIPSSKFQKSHEYYNPNRTDYASPSERTTRKMACSAFDLDGELLYDVANEETQFRASNNDFYVKTLKFEAYQQGFFYITEDYIYSKYSRISDSDQYLNDEAKFYDLNDEVIKQLNENCQAGDLRVRLYTRSLPPFITIVGEQQNSNIVPHRINNSESFFIVKEGEIEIPQLIHEITSTCDSKVFDMRLLSFVVVFVGYIICGSSSIYFFKHIPLVPRSLFVTPLVVSCIELSIEIYFYSVDDIRLVPIFGFEFLFPLLSLLMLNTLCRLWKEYKYLKSLKQKSD